MHPKFVASIILNSFDDNRPHVNIFVNSFPLKGLLDSGANCTILGEGALEFVRKINLPTYPLTNSVKTADGTSHQSICYVNLPITFNNKTNIIATMIIPSLTKPIILGMDFWNAFNIQPIICNQVDVNAIPNPNNLTPDQQKELDAVIKLFPSYEEGTPLKRTQIFEHVIDTGDTKPIKQRYYPVSPYIQKEIDAELQRMLELGVIKPSISPWSSPVVVVRKKPSNKVRICLDSRKLNKVTKTKSYPLPYISRILGNLKSTKYLTSIDLKDAFWQIPLEESSKEKTAFTISGRGLFEFQVLPFGLSNSAQTQCQVVDSVLGYDLEPKCFTYMDDIICATETFDEHVECLKTIASRLTKGNLTVNLEKSKFCHDKLKYLGFMLTKDGIQVDQGKVSAILDFPSPKNVKNVRSMLGMIEWYRRFIPDFSIIAAPITNLLKKSNSKFNWTVEAESAFNRLKLCLTSAPILATPDYSLEFTIQTDACDLGMGAVITQVQQGNERVIEYMSQKFSPAQQKYSTTEKECLAVILAVEKFRCYIEGVNFTVITDHSSLTWLHNLKDPAGRLARWALRLQAYNYNLVYRKGKLNVVPDALSRSVGSLDFVKDDFSLDLKYNELRNRIIKFPENFPDFRVDGNIIFKHTKNPKSYEFGWKLLVPSNLQSKILLECHDDPKSAHGGITKTISRIKCRYYWPSMNTEIKNYVRKCEVCQTTKTPNIILRNQMGEPKLPSKPWEMISIDLIGPLPRSKNGNIFLLVILDIFSKFVLLHPIRKADSKSVIKYLENNVFMLFGVPNVAIQDNGSQFISKMYKDFLKEYEVKPWYIASYHAQANSVERSNQVIKNAIRAYIKDSHKEWDFNIPQIGCSIRSAIQESTKNSPYYLNFGQHMKLSGKMHDIDDVLQSLENVKSERLIRLKEIRKVIVTNLKSAYDKYSKNYNLRTRSIVFKPGDIVLKRNFKLSDATKDYSAGLGLKFIKCKVVEKMGRNCYRLKDMNNKDIGIFNVKDLNIFHS